MTISRFVSRLRGQKPRPPSKIQPMPDPVKEYWRARRRNVCRQALPWFIVLVLALIALPFTL